MANQSHKVIISEAVKTEIERFARNYPGFEHAFYNANVHETLDIDLDGNRSVSVGLTING